MDEKLKAIELVKKMLPYVSDQLNTEVEWSHDDIALENTKKCAHIVCNEQIQYIADTTLSQDNTEYWQEVKRKIEEITVNDI